MYKNHDYGIATINCQSFRRLFQTYKCVKCHIAKQMYSTCDVKICKRIKGRHRPAIGVASVFNNPRSQMLTQ